MTEPRTSSISNEPVEDRSRTVGPATDPTVVADEAVGDRRAPSMVVEPPGGRHSGSGTRSLVERHALRMSLVSLGIVVLGAWGGIVPYIGPALGYNALGGTSWVWNLQHALLYLIPGAAAVLGGLVLMGLVPRKGRGRFAANLAGALVIVAGAWFVIGPIAWPVLYTTNVFVPDSALGNLTHQIGYNLGVGILLVAMGSVAAVSGSSRRRAAAPVDPVMEERLAA